MSSEPAIGKDGTYNFCTGSSYTGELDEEGKMTGFGTYRYPNGTKYVGHFKRGAFHGNGMIVHPSKFKMCGDFVKGKCEKYEIFFGDGLQFYKDNWKYCTPEDRRFWIEIVQGMSPIGEQYLTKEKPARQIPRGFYDNTEGLFDPKSEYVKDPENGRRMRYICPEEKNRILQTCRMNEIDFHEKQELIASSKDYDISTDSWVSSDHESE